MSLVMKTLFIADVSLNTPTSGAEKVLYQQAIGLVGKGDKVYAITRKDGSLPDAESINFPGIHELSFRTDKNHTFWFIFSILKNPSRLFDELTRKNSFAAAVCHQPFTGLSLLLFSKLQKIPMIYVFHSPSHEEYLLSNGHSGWLKSRLQVQARKRIEGFCLKKAKKIVVLSRYMQQKVTQIHRVPSHRIVVNFGGVDLNHFKPLQNRRLAKEEVGFSKGKVHLITIRNLEPRMGLDNLLKALDLLRENRKDIHLIIGGEGIERKNLENLIAKYSLADEVTMTGFIPEELLPKYFGAADFFILPSRQLEGFGLVTPESLACGTPVLGTPVGGTKEILSGFDPQFLFSGVSPEAIAQGIQAAITGLFNNAEQYNQLRLRCRKYAATNYSWQRHIDQLKELIDEIRNA